MMRVKRNGMRMKAMLLVCAMLLAMALSSCTAFMKDAALDTRVNADGAWLPVVTGFLKNDSINSKLESEFRPAAERVKALADESDGEFSVEYRLTEKKSGLFGGEYLVGMYIL